MAKLENPIWSVRKVMAVVTSAKDLVIHAWWDLMLRLKMAIIPKMRVSNVATARNRKPIIPEVPPFATKLRAIPVGKIRVMILNA